METIALSLVLLVLALALACDPGLTAPTGGGSGTSGAGGSSFGVSASSGLGAIGGSNASGWPSFGGGVASAGGAGGASDAGSVSGMGGAVASSTSASAGGAGSSSQTAASSMGGGGGAMSWSQTDGGSCDLGRVVIGEVRTRGLGGASDEFIALFNATPAPVTLDASYSVTVRSTTSTSFRAHWTGSGGVIPAFGHFLIGGSAYAQSPVPDARMSIGVTDAAAIRLVHGGVTVDTLCFGYDATTMAAFDASFACTGVASNLPHDNGSTATSDVDASLARKPGGYVGNCASSGDAAVDFVTEEPATPASSVSLAGAAFAREAWEAP